MNIIRKTKQLKRLAELLEKENTGNSFAFAKKVGVSRTHLFELLEDLKGMEIHVKFDRKKGSFLYTGSKRLLVKNPIQIIEDSELKKLNNS